MKTNILALELFNSVLKTNQEDADIIVNNTHGFVIESGSPDAESDVVSFFKNKKVSGQDLNKTFHKSWYKVQESTREELLVHQVLHYLTTYGDLSGTDFVYIPNEELDVPELDELSYKVIHTLTEKELTQKCLSLLSSGIALKEETLKKVFTLLESLDYTFSGDEEINNKEAVILIADRYSVFPKDPVDALRYCVYKSTDSTLLIKNKMTIDLIKESRFNPNKVFNFVGLKNMATIFNRFKPLFLAYKKHCPKVINKISKLSKEYHKPLPVNALSEATQRKLTNDDKHWLDNATEFSLFKALNACWLRLQGQDTFTYAIRNGRSYTKENTCSLNKDELQANYEFIFSVLKEKAVTENKVIYEPENINYALPTSEKLFVGNVPFGTKVISDKLSAGIYWENEWGANDLDLSTINLDGKIGWNSDYYNKGQTLTYSGDMTYADNGAVEYFYVKGNVQPTLLFNNIYSGRVNCEFNLVVGLGDKPDRKFMMNPNKVLASEGSEMKKRAALLGFFLPEKDGNVSYTFFNVATTNAQVSGRTEVSDLFLESLKQQFTNQLMLKPLFEKLGFKFTNDKKEANIDLSIDKLDRNTFIDLFSKKIVLEN